MSDPQRSLQQLLVTNFGSIPADLAGYVGSQGSAGYVGSVGLNGSNGTLGYVGSTGPNGTASDPKITAITYSGDDTATNTAGGDTITLTGSNFAAGATVVINKVQASVVSVVNSTTITFTAPAMATGSYIVYVVNTDGGTALAVPGIQYSGTPAWTTAAGTLGTVTKQTSFTANLVATGEAPITYSVSSGTLPSGITLSANTGVLSGTAPNVSSTTTYNFTVRSTDAQRQDTDRAFSVTVNAIITIPITYLVVGPGGTAGGVGLYGGGGAGGSGGAVFGTLNYDTPGSTLTVVVGFSSGAYYQPGTNSSLSGAGFIRTAFAGGNGGFRQNGGTAAGYDGYVGLGGSQGDGNTSVGGAQGIGGNYQPGTNGGAGTFSGGGGGGSGGNAHGYPDGGTGGAGGQRNWTSNTVLSTVDTGWGAGGARNTGNSGTQGIVIIKYPDTYPAAASYTGSYSVSGGYRTYTFGSAGSITF